MNNDESNRGPSESLREKYSEALAWINKSTITQSLLYDLDLLPEQLKVGTREWYTMILIAQHIRAAFDAGKNENNLSEL